MTRDLKVTSRSKVTPRFITDEQDSEEMSVQTHDVTSLSVPEEFRTKNNHLNLVGVKKTEKV